MAGEWIPMSNDLWTCPQIVRIHADMCPQNVRDMSARCRIIGALYRTWSLVDVFAEDGVLEFYTPEALDAEVGIEGWTRMLESVGWMVVESQRLVIPNFEKWFSRSTKRRLKETKRKQATRQAGPQNVRTHADKMRTREQKSTEENNTKVDTNVSTCGDPAGPPPQSTETSHSEFGFPTRNGQTWYLPSRKLEEYRDSYGDALDLPAEFAKAREWLRANKSKRKTATGMPKFLTGWLNRACDRGPPTTAATDDPDAILRQRRAKRRAQTSDTE